MESPLTAVTISFSLHFLPVDPSLCSRADKNKKAWRNPTGPSGF